MEDEKKVVPVEENSTEAEATVSEPEAVEEASPAEDPKVEESENFGDSNASGFDKFFGISKRKTTLRIEIIAGIVTFLAMCYILVVNPNNIIDAFNAYVHLCHGGKERHVLPAVEVDSVNLGCL